MMTINLPAECEDFVRQAVATGVFKNPEDVIRRALHLLEREHKLAAGASNEKRCGGQWKGRVKIADDFDELPPDFQDAFGMRRG